VSTGVNHLCRPIAILLASGALLLGGCSTDPATRSPARADATEAARVAASMEGKPYRYGGISPTGFDCSGLVYYSFRRAGIDVPRTTPLQRSRSHRVELDNISRGDLVFFNQEGKFSSHVGIYLGNDRFIHAPSTGKRVRVDKLSDRYWQKHLVDARRVL
jgi:murein DD-endopeptidase